MGMVALCIALAAAPRHLRAKDAILEIILPFAGAMGTACIAMASNQSLFPPYVLCIAGLAALGIGYCWFVVRYGLLLARSQSISLIVYCLAAALIMEPIVRVTLESSFDQTVRVCIAIAMPLVSMVLFHRAHQLMRQENAASTDMHPKPHHISDQGEIKKQFILLFATSLLLATVRTVSPVGTWDAPFDPVPMTSSFGLVALYAICVALFARFALVEMQSKSTLSRFQPAFLVVVLTLFASLILPYAQGPQSAILYTIMCLDDSFAHMLFWASIACMVKSISMPSYKIAGLAIGVYAAGSIVWLLLIGNSETLQAPVMVAVIAILYALTLVISNANGTQQTPQPPVTANAATTSAEPSETPAPADRAATSIEERCLELSREYKLSPRETEVITLLAQGRTRLYIQEELILAENTVKTHIAHIYKKLNVGNRQDLLDLVFKKN